MEKRKKVNTYRILYAFCFFALMLIDWSRGSQLGTTWAMTTNFTGVVVALILFSWSEKKRYLKLPYLIWTVLGGLSIPLTLVWWQNHQTIIYRDKLWSAVLNIWLLVYFLIYEMLYWKKDFGKILISQKKNLILYVMLFWMFLSLNEDIWPIWFLLMAILIVGMPKNAERISVLKKGAVDGIIVSFFLLQGLAFVFRPYDMFDKRYVGIYSNANMNALFYCVVIMAIVVRLSELQDRNAPKWQVICLRILLVGVFCFLLMTVSRTGFLTVMVIFITQGVWVYLYLQKKTAKQLILRIICFLLMIIVMLPVTYSAARYLPPVFHHPIWFDGEYDEAKVHSWDPINSPKYVTFEELLNQLHVRSGVWGKFIPSGLYPMKSHAMEFFVDEPDEVTNYKEWGVTLFGKYYHYGDEELSKHESLYARLSIWEHYIKHGTLFGHSNSWGHRTGMWGVTWHGQNAFVQIWFYYGIPAAILYLLLIIVNIKDAFGDGKQGILTAYSMIVATVFGLFEATWYPSQMVLFLLVFAPLLFGGVEVSKNQV